MGPQHPCVRSCVGALLEPLRQYAQLQTPLTGTITSPRTQRLQWEGLSVHRGPHSRLSGRQHGRGKCRGGGQPGQSARVCSSDCSSAVQVMGSDVELRLRGWGINAENEKEVRCFSDLDILFYRRCIANWLCTSQMKQRLDLILLHELYRSYSRSFKINMPRQPLAKSSNIGRLTIYEINREDLLHTIQHCWISMLSVVPLTNLV